MANKEETQNEVSPVDSIGALYNAMFAVDDLDAAVLGEDTPLYVRRIRKRSVKLIDYYVGVMYKEAFGKPNKREDEDE